MQSALENFTKEFLEKTEGKDISIISHDDTDGITSAAIMIKTMQNLGKTFSVQIIRQIEKEFIESLPKDKVLFFLDLASNNLDSLSKLKNDIFIIDHHEIVQTVPIEIQIFNPHLYTGHSGEEISAAGLAYLFAKQITGNNKELANLAVLGMVGDTMDRNLSRINKSILEEANTIVKRGLLLYPATRPLNKALEFSSGIYIPGVTGSYRGASSLLKEVGIEKINGAFKSLLDLTEEEMSKLITAILLKKVKMNNKDELIGNIYLIKFFNKLQDARELSAMINACSNLGESGIALSFCLGNKKAIEQADTIYTRYKQHLVQALNLIQKMEKEEGKAYVIINAKDQIKDTIIGNVASILSRSRDYEEGKIIIAMAHSNEKIKISARSCGECSRNVREVLSSIVTSTGGEVGGHAFAAGCLISKDKENEFINLLKKHLEIELVKIQ